jgi:RhoGAP domain
LIAHFELYPELLKTEGLFRIAASLDKIDELQMHVIMGNYFFLTKLTNEPHVVANFLKKVLKYMGEPLCTFRLYSRFRDLQDIAKPAERKHKLREVCSELPLINRNVFVFIIRFFNKVIA